MFFFSGVRLSWTSNCLKFLYLRKQHRSWGWNKSDNPVLQRLPFPGSSSCNQHAGTNSSDDHSTSHPGFSWVFHWIVTFISNAVVQYIPSDGGNGRRVNYGANSHRLEKVSETNKDNCCATCFQANAKFTNFGHWVGICQMNLKWSNIQFTNHKQNICWL